MRYGRWNKFYESLKITAPSQIIIDDDYLNEFIINIYAISIQFFIHKFL